MQRCTIKDKINSLKSDSAVLKDRGVFNKVIGNTYFTGNAVMFYTVGEVGISC